MLVSHDWQQGEHRKQRLELPGGMPACGPRCGKLTTREAQHAASSSCGGRMAHDGQPDSTMA